MSDVIVLILVALIFLQLPVSLIVRLDAKRLNLKQPVKYELGIVVPAAGFMVLIYYLSKRRELPKREE